MVRWTIVRRFTLVVAAAALTACSEPITAPSSDASAPSLSETQTAPSLLKCQWNFFDITWGVLGPLGGLLSLNGHSIVVPRLALDRLAFITLRTPTSRFVEIEARVNGQDHFDFGQPVIVTLDYSRCRSWELGPEPVTVWQIDPDTKAFIQDMGGVDDRVNKRITFTTDHFSGYAVAQ
ncbi:MAG TPA: hypothetical protein VJ650_09870 [Gemmatimonadaceae bacterium]|nr:hypothetical protein [Gemmatimonadaceae bacterium]